ncbi:MAG: sensor histidine kinase [Rhodopseudomonas palustris]|nr:sensor histidine kinase [Rhodopseudomonas palustris]
MTGTCCSRRSATSSTMPSSTARPAPAVTLAASETGDVVEISVADRGPGVPAAERDKVMDRFYRSAAVAGVPGSGLGLSLVNAIAHHHGGQLVLTDNAPGLRATLRLPKAPGAGPGPLPELARAAVTQ